MSDDSPGGLPTPTPSVNPETQPYWNATADGRLMLRQCTDCDEAYHYPRNRCPACYSESTEWIDASGYGEIYSFTVTHGGVGGDYAEATPFVLAYVTLDEGPRMLTNIVDVDITGDRAGLAIGQEVEVVFAPVSDGDNDHSLPRFKPVR